MSALVDLCIEDFCKVRAEGTMGNEPNCRKAGRQYLRSTADHVGTGGDGRAWLQHECCTPMDCQCPISGRQDWWYRSCQDYWILLDRLLDIMAEVFYLIYGLYIVVKNNGK